MTRPPALRLLLSLFLLAAAPFPAVGQETLTYSGSQTIALSILFDGGIAAFERKGGGAFSRISTEGGTRQGIEDLLGGKALIAGSMRPLTGEEKGKGLVETPIGVDRVAIWVNRENPVEGITSAQLKGIMGGKIRNWKELGGADQPVEVMLAPPGTRTVSQEMIQSIILGKEPMLSDPLWFPLPQDQIREVSRRPGGICLTSHGLAANLDPSTMGEVKHLALDGVPPDLEGAGGDRYTLSRTLYLVTRGEPAGVARGFIDFMVSPEGQAVVERNFTPVAGPPAPPAAQAAGPGDRLIFTGSQRLATAILFNGALTGFEKQSGLGFSSLDLAGGGPQSVLAVASGKATVAAVTVPLTPAEKQEGLAETLIGWDFVTVWANRKNPVSSLAGGQLKDLLTGKARNWKDLGGPDLAVVLVLAPKGTRTSARDVVGRVLLGKEPYREDFAPVPDPVDQIREVFRQEGALCLSGGAMEVSLEASLLQGVKVLPLDGVAPSAGAVASGKYPLKRPILLVTKGPPAGTVKRFVDYMLSPEGQAVVAKSFVPVTP